MVNGTLESIFNEIVGDNSIEKVKRGALGQTLPIFGEQAKIEALRDLSITYNKVREMVGYEVALGTYIYKNVTSY